MILIAGNGKSTSKLTIKKPSKEKKAKYEFIFKILLSNTIRHQPKPHENLVTTLSVPTN